MWAVRYTYAILTEEAAEAERWMWGQASAEGDFDGRQAGLADF
jgi:hypothetical protein